MVRINAPNACEGSLDAPTSTAATPPTPPATNDLTDSTVELVAALACSAVFVESLSDCRGKHATPSDATSRTIFKGDLD